MKSLKDLQTGEVATVVGFTNDGGHTKRLQSLGLVPGATVTIRRAAPLGDPLQVSFRGLSIGLRRTETDCITVKPHN